MGRQLRSTPNPDKPSEAKHVESRKNLRMDESSTLSSSTKIGLGPTIQGFFVKLTVKLGAKRLSLRCVLGHDIANTLRPTHKQMSSTRQLNQLPAFAFVAGGDHEQPNPLQDRDVVLHIPTGTLIEFFDQTDEIRQQDINQRLYHNFKYRNNQNEIEHMCAIVHSSPTLSIREDAELIRTQIIIPACKWYGAYCDWYDIHIDDPAH